MSFRVAALYDCRLSLTILWPDKLGDGMYKIFRLAWVFALGLTAVILVVAVTCLCKEHAPSSPVKARLAMILAVDFTMCAGKELKTVIVLVNPPQDNKF